CWARRPQGKSRGTCGPAPCQWHWGWQGGSVAGNCFVTNTYDDCKERSCQSATHLARILRISTQRLAIKQETKTACPSKPGRVSAGCSCQPSDRLSPAGIRAAVGRRPS